jgi:hypothetical protein
MLRGGEGSADSHDENRRTETWATKVRSEVQLRWIGAPPGLSRPRQGHAPAERVVAVSGPAVASTRRWELQAASWPSTRSVVNNMRGHARSSQERHHRRNELTAATRTRA